MTTKTICFIILGLFSFAASILAYKNKKKSDETRKRMSDKVRQAKNIVNYKNSLDFQHPISNSIINLLENFDMHEQVGKKLNKEEIKSREFKLKLNLPESYKIFLKYF